MAVLVRPALSVAVAVTVWVPTAALAGDHGEALAGVTGSGGFAVIAQLNDFSLAIACAVEEQTATTAEMTRATAETAASSGDIAGTVAEVAAVASQTASGATSAERAATTLSGLATDLSTLVGRFRV